MSTDSSKLHYTIDNKDFREARYDGLRPRTVNSTFTNFKGSKVTQNGPRFYENPLKHIRNRSLSPKSQTNRIHSLDLPKRSAAPPTATNKNNLSPRLIVTRSSTSYATNSSNAWFVGPNNSPPIRPPNRISDRDFSTLELSNNAQINTIASRPILISSTSISPPVERHRELFKAEHKNITTSGQMKSRNNETRVAYSTRHPQGHKAPPRSRSATRAPETTTTVQDFDRHRREVHTIVSTLGSRLGALENTIAAALPVVVEARLLWMENAIVRASAKLGTTRRVFCEYYGNPRYETYTRSIRTRAYYLGLTLDDLEYLQERLESLGSQSAKQETLLISPFGGANEAGDKTMVEAYRRDSKHGGYARRICRVCYESLYSVDEDWMPPVPAPDNPTLVEKIKGWLHGPNPSRNGK